MPREVYHYSILRFVPNPVREEALNLGVMLIRDEGGYADYRMLARIKTRIRVAAPGFDIRLLESFEADLRSLIGGVGFQRRLGASQALIVQDLVRLADTHANQIQFTDPRVYLTEEPDKALDDLFVEFVRPRRTHVVQKGSLIAGRLRTQYLAHSRNGR